MRNNPFITIFLLIFINIIFYDYIDYNDLILPSSEFADVMPIFVFSIPIISLFILIFIKNIKHKKEFKNFSIFLFIATIIVFVVLSFLTAYAGAYYH